MVRQRDSERAAEMRWCWVWQHFSLDALKCNVMDKRFSSPKMPTRRSLSQMASRHHRCDPSQAPSPRSRGLGFGSAPELKPSPQNTRRKGPSLVHPRCSHRKLEVPPRSVCAAIQKRTGAVLATHAKRKRGGHVSIALAARIDDRRPPRLGEASTRQKKEEERKVPVHPSQHTHTLSLRRHTTALPIMSSLVVA